MRTRRFCTSQLHKGPRWLCHTEFYVKVWGDESKTWPAQLQSRCIACQRIDSRIRSAEKHGRELQGIGKPRELGGVGRKEILRRKRVRYQEWIEQPGNRQRRRDQQREYAREWSAAKRREMGVPERGRRNKTETRVMLDAQPLLEWIDSFEGSGDNAFSQYSRLSDNTQHALRRARQQGVMELGAVDRVCVELSREDVLAVLYGSN